MKKYLLLPPLVLTLIALVRLSCFTVDAAEYVYVTVVGEHRVTYDGNDLENGAGLKIGWPWPIQQVQRLDRRLQHFDLAPTEQLTHEGTTVDKILLLEAYVCWKIKNDVAVDRFVRRIGTAARAREILGPQINGRLGAAIGQMPMGDLVNTTVVNPATGQTKVDVTLDRLRVRLLNDLKKDIVDEYGIELVDIRLRRFNHPASVRDSIFARIRSERSKEATRYLSEGDREATDIASKTDQEVREALAKARAKEEEIKADADLKANKTRNDAYSQDPEFFAFVKKMEKFQSILGSDKTMLLLSTHREMFDLMFKEPQAPMINDKKGSK